MNGMANLPFTYEELQEAVRDKRVTRRDHPTLPYGIYNYTDEVQYLNIWDDITLNCRGLIIDHSGNLICRPWRKFFNLGQVDLPVQTTDPVEVMDKADGSLGILYPIVIENPEVSDILYGIATRGSFSSNQAWHATGLWKQKYSNFDPHPEYTMLFEIIYPKNRVVLNYGDLDDLMLLGAVENSTGYYVGPNTARFLWYERGPHRDSQWPGPVVEVMPFNTISDALANTSRKNAEGFVIRSHNFMVKIKQPDYLELHKLVTNLSPKTIWEELRRGKNRTQIVSNFPDEFHKDVDALIRPLQDQFRKRSEEIYCKYIELVGKIDTPVQDENYRKVFALTIKKNKDARYMFLLLDGKSITETLWNELRPRETDELRQAASAN